MPRTAFLFAGSPEDAVLSAAEWGWIAVASMHLEFERPDSRQRVRYVPDMIGTMDNFAFSAPAYIGRNWSRRKDVCLLASAVEHGLLKVEDPKLPPPRERRSTRTERLGRELRNLLGMT